MHFIAGLMDPTNHRTGNILLIYFEISIIYNVSQYTLPKVSARHEHARRRVEHAWCDANLLDFLWSMAKPEKIPIFL